MLSHLTEAYARPILDMTGRYLVFAIAYRNPAKDPDMSFPRAARSWMRDAINHCSMTPGLDVDYKLHFVDTAPAFRSAWLEIDLLARNTGRQVLYGNILTHADSVGTRPGIQLMPPQPDSRDATIDPRRFGQLQVLPWSRSGLLIFCGCYTGVEMENYGMSFAKFAAEKQGVSTIGQRGYASFSRDFDSYKETTRADPGIWLWAYRGRSNFKQPHGVMNTYAPTGGRISGEFNRVYA